MKLVVKIYTKFRVMFSHYRKIEKKFNIIM